jgi:hypothetical protein
MNANPIFHQLSLATRSTTEPTAPQPRAVFADTKAFIETNLEALLMGWSAAFTQRQLGYKKHTEDTSHGTTHDRH